MPNPPKPKPKVKADPILASTPRAGLAARPRRSIIRYRIDLHTHSNASDGEHSPAELIHLARARGLRVLAVTDHDTTDGVEPALAAASSAGGLTVLPGVELSTDLPGREIHILGYLIDWQNPEFQTMLARFREGRIGRARKMVARLAELGAPVSFDRVQEIAGDGAIGRPHVAQALVEARHVESVQQAFDLYLANDRPAYFPHFSLPPGEAVALIRQAHGIPVLAHPRGLTDLIPDLLPAGLLGLECYYPEYDERQRRVLLELARQYGLVATGGSDFHGLHKMGHMSGLGEVYVPAEAVERLEKLKRELG